MKAIDLSSRDWGVESNVSTLKQIGSISLGLQGIGALARIQGVLRAAGSLGDGKITAIVHDKDVDDVQQRIRQQIDASGTTGLKDLQITVRELDKVEEYQIQMNA